AQCGQRPRRDDARFASPPGSKAREPSPRRMNENIQIDSKSGYPMKDVIKFERPMNKLKVLLADDEPALQELMHLELPRMGHEVTVCPDGNTAVAALQKNTYDCIIVDLDMPGLSGIQVIGKCKELSPDTDAVVLTGKGS